MDCIELSGTKYPVRFDFRALKEFKTITKNDVLKSFDAKDTDNIIILTYVAIKSGYYFTITNPNAAECPITEEQVARAVEMKDMVTVIQSFLGQIKPMMPKEVVEAMESEEPGEIPGIDLKASPLEG
jgi:hypothetical protein